MSSRPAPKHIPVLTEVLEVDVGDFELSRPMLDEALAPLDESVPADEASAPPDQASGPTEDAPAPAAAQQAARRADEQALVERVLGRLHRQIDATIERRVQSAMEPIWRRLTEDLADEVRTAITLSLGEVLRDAVKAEMENTQRRLPGFGDDSDENEDAGTPRS